jgi:hypothetical protein
MFLAEFLLNTNSARRRVLHLPFNTSISTYRTTPHTHNILVSVMDTRAAEPRRGAGKIPAIARREDAAVLEFPVAARCAVHSGHDFQRIAGTSAACIAGIYEAGESQKKLGWKNARPHPNPLPQGEGFYDFRCGVGISRN